MAKVALLIGVGNYEHPDDLKPLVSASKDVAAMQRILLNAQMGEFTEVIPLIDPDPMQMQEAIETLYRDRAKDDLVLLFFSGHGIKDDGGKLYFSTRVTRKTPKGELVKSTAVPARFVQEIMGNSRSRRQVMILDCCFSGAFDPALNSKDDGSVNLQELGAEGRVVLTSSSSTEYSFEQQGSELSIYTRFLVEGIETGAADRDNDGKVSVRELHEYATKKVQETAPKMNPKIIVLKDEGFDVVFAKAQITDPKLKYRKEAERYSMRGEISPAGRTLLNTKRVRLDLTIGETQEIEDQVLQPFRDRLKHLEDYRSAFVAEVERQYPLTPETANVLKDLQEILGLREEDVTQVEQDVTAQIASKPEADQQKPQGYEQTPIETLQAEVSVQSTLEQPKNMVRSSQESEAKASEAIEVFFSDSRKDSVPHPIELEEGGGQVPLDSPFYMERPPIESRCYEVIVKPGALIRIKAPRQMGKSSLTIRIFDHAGKQSYRAVWLQLQQTGEQAFASLDSFLQWLCRRVTAKLRLQDKVAEYWQSVSASTDKCTDYFELYLLEAINAPLVLCLDEVDEVFKHPEIASDFFGLLRSWHEESKINPVWRNLRLVITHSEEVYIPLNINQSPFNVGVPIELPPLNRTQLGDLVQRHGLTWSEAEVEALMAMVGGQPFLARVALQQIASGTLTLAQFLQVAPTQAGLFASHLRRHLGNLQERQLEMAMKQVVTATQPVQLPIAEASKLANMGLVSFHVNEVVPLCNLYRQYFRDVLGGNR